MKIYVSISHRNRGHKRILTSWEAGILWWEAASLKHNLGLWFLLSSSQLLTSRSVFPNTTFSQSSACQLQTTQTSLFLHHFWRLYHTKLRVGLCVLFPWQVVFCCGRFSHNTNNLVFSMMAWLVRTNSKGLARAGLGRKPLRTMKEVISCLAVMADYIFFVSPLLICMRES